MMYQNLAKYYDSLFLDDDAFIKWEKFVRDRFNEGTILELASGSGELANKLSREYDIVASDISEEMLDILHTKFPHLKYKKLDMRNFEDKVDCILCFCDSINYLNDLNEVRMTFQSVYNSLNENGLFMFDIHSINRLAEFKDGYIEEGYIENTPYIWNVILDENKLIHNFRFYDDSIIQEQQIQTVFDIKDIIGILTDIGFKYSIYTDFDFEGVCDGEKYFIVGEKI